MKDSRRTTIVLPRELVAEVDATAGRRGRSKYIEEALTEKLERERMRKVLREAAGSIDPKDYPHWSTPEKISAWVEQMRMEDDPMPENKE